MCVELLVADATKCEMCVVICFLHTEGQPAVPIHVQLLPLFPPQILYTIFLISQSYKPHTVNQCKLLMKVNSWLTFST